MVQSVMMIGECTGMVFYWINPTVSNKRVEVYLLWAAVFALIRIVGGSAVFSKSNYSGQGVKLCRCSILCRLNFLH